MGLEKEHCLAALVNVENNLKSYCLSMFLPLVVLGGLLCYLFYFVLCFLWIGSYSLRSEQDINITNKLALRFLKGEFKFYMDNYLFSADNLSAFVTNPAIFYLWVFFINKSIQPTKS